MIINYREKFKHLITEGTYKQLANVIQDRYFKNHSIESYQQLNDEQKRELSNLINVERLAAKQMVEKITSNIYYQSWIYDVLISGEQKFPEDYEKIDQAIQDFTKISRSSKLTSEQKDIRTYKTFSDLHQFLYEFKSEYTQYKPLEYDLFYQNDKYAVYEINNPDFVNFSKLLYDLNIAWCVKQKNYFTHYGPPYYMIVNKSDNKPYALLHVNSGQIKDVHDRGLRDSDPAIFDIFLQFKDIDYSKNDFRFYKVIYIKHKNPDITDSQLFCELYPSYKLGENNIITGSRSGVRVSEDELGPFIKDGNFDLMFDPSVQFYSNTLRKTNGKNLMNAGLLNPQETLSYVLGNYCRKNEDGSCDILVDLTVRSDSFLLKDGKIICKINKSKSFLVKNCGLKTLENCPTEVNGYFDVEGNNLTTLEHGPTYVKYDYKCSNNPLKSLDHLPEKVYNLHCNNTDLVDLHSDTLTEVATLNATDNKKLLSLNNNYNITKKLNISRCEQLSNVSSLSNLKNNIVLICSDSNKIDKSSLSSYNVSIEQQ